MYKRIDPEKLSNWVTFPHCDPRILHAPGECEYCDAQPLWQYLRQVWGIAFTGYTPEGKELPCPADNARGNDHKIWYGNVARPSTRVCTREKPHVCGSNGPCNGLPMFIKDKPCTT